MGGGDKPIVWLHGEIKTPPMSAQARLEAGHLILVLEVLKKKTQSTPSEVIKVCRRRLADYDQIG
jgi:hypothetical protein